MVKDPIQILDNVFSSGELEGVEQSLALKTDRSIFVLTGCAHPAMKSILGAAAKLVKLYGIAGGFHGFVSFSAFSDLSLICPCHCTMYKQEIRDFFNDKALEYGAGLVIKL
jgi:7,8-dihydropterin-6-yl-methyl-4-(beta-D-ribofuranosyl)aminobenzene 5'-phosphate synthase